MWVLRRRRAARVGRAARRREGHLQGYRLAGSRRHRDVSFHARHAVPSIQVDSITPTQEPDEPYLSP
ncbi:MAG: hypothetical protein WDO13_07550 [Verrucomicrobiota bacterium]